MNMVNLSRIALIIIISISIALLFLTKNETKDNNEIKGKEEVLSAVDVAEPIETVVPTLSDENKGVSTVDEIISKPITLTEIFDNITPSVPQDENTWTLLVTGDVMLGRTVNFNTIKANDFTWAWKNTKDLLSQADYTLINLENPLVQDCPVKNDGMIFCGDLRHIEGLQFAGVDGASLANNHAMNHGIDGLEETEKLLEDNNIDTIGVSNPTYKDIKGTKVAFLGYTDVECPSSGIKCAEEELIKNEIEEAKLNSDMVIVFYHWGSEYTYDPSTRQKELARLSIDSGADLVLGNHPHWYQSAEIYKDKLIMYSHGNFIFDQMWSENTKEGLVGEYTFSGKNLTNAKFTPIYITDFGIANIANDGKSKAILENFEKISLKQ